MNLSLYKVADDYLHACDVLMNNEGDLPAEVVHDTLESLSGDVEQKSLNVAAYHNNLQKEIDTMKTYEKDMRDRRMRLENHTRQLKNYLKSNMVRCQITKIKGPEFSLSLRKKIASVIIDDIDELPQNYIARTEAHPDKNKIKAAIQQGEMVPGAHLEEGTSLIIR